MRKSTPIRVSFGVCLYLPVRNWHRGRSFKDGKVMMRSYKAGLLACSFCLLFVAVAPELLLAKQRSERRGRPARRMRDDNAPKVGDVAPTFTLMSLDGKSETDLAMYRGKKPVVLFFGSYT